MGNKIIAYLKKNRLKTWEILLKIDPRNYGIFSKYGYYLFISSLFILFFVTFLLINGYVHLISPPKYVLYSNIVGVNYALFGYMGVFIITAFSPLPDYFIVPILGYMAYLGFFNFWFVVMVSSLADLFLMGIDYAGGRFAGRTIVIKLMELFRVKASNLDEAEGWIMKHGFISIFIATFIPFVKHIISVAAGTLRMNAGVFFLSNFIGFFIRFLFLAFVGFRGIYIFSPSFDYMNRLILYVVGLASLGYVIYYIMMKVNKFRKILIQISGLIKS